MKLAAHAAIVAIAVASWLAAGPAWGHSFPPNRTVVAQVEACELVVMVGYRPGTGEATQTALARAANSPKSHTVESLRDVLGTTAMAPLTVAIDGHALVPTRVRAKLGVEPGGARPMVVVLVTYALVPGHSLAISSADSRNTRISWQDRASGRVDLVGAPAQDRWFDGVASFLLKLSPSWGTSGCATPSSPPPPRSQP
jgi:hypothetical protein